MFAVEAGRWAPVLRPPAAWFFERLARTSDLVTTSSLSMAPHLPGRVKIMPNGADLVAARRANGDAIRGRYTPPIVGFVGSFEYCVDFRLMIDAAVLLPDVTFLLVGAGREWESVQQQIRDRQLNNVILTGPVPYPRNLDYIQAMDICLVPRLPGRISDHAAPLKLFEYASLQKPIIVTPMRDTQALAGDFVNVVHNGQEAAALIERILADPDAFRARAQAGYEQVCATYNWDRIAGEFADVVSHGYEGEYAEDARRL
jgi:glycosyltransferase involved in cell wall biosynthesis